MRPIWGYTGLQHELSTELGLEEKLRSYFSVLGYDPLFYGMRDCEGRRGAWCKIQQRQIL
jgi:hypothetical protein